MSTSKAFALIAGVGPGTGRSLALRFSQGGYSCILMSRSKASWSPVVEEIKSLGRVAHGFDCDVSDSKSVNAAFAGLRQVLDTSNGHLNVAIYNVGGKMIRKPFLELEEKDINVGWDANGRGLVLFSQAALPNLLSSVAVNPPHSPSLLLTGATASLRGGTQMASFAAGKFAMRAIGQSIAREFSPQGIHTVHFIIDGLIDTEGTKGFKSKEEKINPDHIADTYWNAHIQPKSCWTQEMDLRPYIETF